MKVFDPTKHDFRPGDKDSPGAGESAREAKHQGERLDEALKLTFPASDPPSMITPTERLGRKIQKRSAKAAAIAEVMR